jgi:hypothetical protein
MFCRIYEPGTTIVSHGQKYDEIFFVVQGSALLYDDAGARPFLQLPQHSFFGEYQILWDLRSNFWVKVGGTDYQRTMFLAIDRETVMRLAELYPKSKLMIQKRGLQRRAVFLKQYDRVKKAEERTQRKKRALQQQLLNRKLGIIGNDASDEESFESDADSAGGFELDDTETIGDDGQLEVEPELHAMLVEEYSRMVEDGETRESEDRWFRRVLALRHDETEKHTLNDDELSDSNSGEETVEKPGSADGQEVSKKSQAEVKRARKLVAQTSDKIGGVAELLGDLDSRMNASFRQLATHFQAVNLQREDDKGQLWENLKDIKKNLLPQMQRMAEEVKAKLQPPEGDNQSVLFDELEEKLGRAEATEAAIRQEAVE